MKSTLRAVLTALSLAIVSPTGALGIGADNFGNRTTISGTHFTDFITPMNTYTRENNEPVMGPNPAANGGNHTAWWRWVAPSDGLCTIEVPETGRFIFKSLAVYTGSSLASLTRVADDSFTGRLSCAVTFYAAAGTDYSISVDAAGVVDPAEAQLILRHLPANYPGKYLGEWQSAFQSVLPSGNGLVSLSVAPGGAVTGVLTAGATRYPFKTQVQTNGYIVAAFPRKTAPGEPLLPPLALRINLSLALSGVTNGSPILVTDGSFIQGYGEIDRVLAFSSKAPTPVAGNFVAGIDFVNFTAGAGYLTAKITPTGKVTIAGATGDGQKFAAGSALVTNGEIPLHQSFASQRGYLNGRLTATDGMVDRINGGGLDYYRPAATSTFYPQGFSALADVTGAAIQKTPAGQRSLGFLNGTMGAGKLTINAAAGEIGGVVENLVFSATNLFSFTNAGRSPKLKLNTATGLVTGSIVEPAGTPRKLVGALYDANGTPRLRGFVSGTKRTAFFTVTP